MLSTSSKPTSPSSGTLNIPWPSLHCRSDRTLTQPFLSQSLHQLGPGWSLWVLGLRSLSYRAQSDADDAHVACGPNLSSFIVDMPHRIVRFQAVISIEIAIYCYWLEVARHASQILILSNLWTSLAINNKWNQVAHIFFVFFTLSLDLGTARFSMLVSCTKTQLESYRSVNLLAGSLCMVRTHAAQPSIVFGTSETINGGSLRRGCSGSPYKGFPISCWLLITCWIDAIRGVVLYLSPKTPPATLDAIFFFVNASNEIVWYAATYSSTGIRNRPNVTATRLRGSAVHMSVDPGHACPPVLVPPIIRKTCHGSIAFKLFSFRLWLTCLMGCFNTNNA